jgi:hypothetical protein
MEESFASKCKREGISGNGIYNYRAKHPELTDEEILNIYASKGESIRSCCKRFGIKENIIYTLRRKYPELTTEQLIKYIIDNNIVTELERRCNIEDLDYNKVLRYRQKSASDDEAIYKYKNTISIRFKKYTFRIWFLKFYFNRFCLKKKNREYKFILWRTLQMTYILYFLIIVVSY